MRLDLNNQSGQSEKILTEFAKYSKRGVYKITFDKSSSLYSEDPVCNHYTICRAEAIINQELKGGSRVEVDWFDKDLYIEVYMIETTTFISYLEAYINEKTT